jgi:hypothetical protein
MPSHSFDQQRFASVKCSNVEHEAYDISGIMEDETHPEREANNREIQRN